MNKYEWILRTQDHKLCDLWNILLELLKNADIQLIHSRCDILNNWVHFNEHNSFAKHNKNLATPNCKVLVPPHIKILNVGQHHFQLVFSQAAELICILNELHWCDQITLN